MVVKIFSWTHERPVFSRKCHLAGSRAPVRPAGCSGRLSHVSEPQECAGFLRWVAACVKTELGVSGKLRLSQTPCRFWWRCSGNAGCGDGTEIPQLGEVHASWIHDLNQVTPLLISKTAVWICWTSLILLLFVLQWTHAGEDCFWSIEEKLAFNLSFSRSACQCQFLLSFLQIYSVKQPYHQHKNTNTWIQIKGNFVPLKQTPFAFELMRLSRSKLFYLHKSGPIGQ